MEPILERVKYPSAPLKRCAQPPIGSAETTALLQQLKETPSFQGAWTVTQGGLPVVILHALDRRHFRAARASMTGVLTWLWNHKFGRLVSFSLVVPSDKRMPRAFFPDDCAIIRLVAEHGRIAFAVAHGNRTTPFYLADFNAHPEHADMLDAFRALLRIENDPHYVFRDDELAFWLLMADVSMHWHGDLPHNDAARATWAVHYQQYIRLLQKFIAQAREETHPELYLTDDAATNLPAVMPFCDEIARLITHPSTSVPEVVDRISAVLDDCSPSAPTGQFELIA